MKTALIPPLSLLVLLAASACATNGVPYHSPGLVPPPPIVDPVPDVAASTAELPARRQSSAGTMNSLALLLGGRVLDNEDWSPLDDQLMLGLEFASVPKYFPVGIEFGYQGSYVSEDVANGASTESLTGGLHEFYVGPRFGTQDPAWALWAGLGFSVIYAKMDGLVLGNKSSDNDTVFGAYAHVGVEYKVSEAFGIGLDARGMYGQDASLDAVERKTSYLQMALLLALHF